jgi:N-terminal acetyltransferase B complex non-catalytic subunit
MLWEKAAKAKPRDQALQMKWFLSAFEGDDWKSAQKVNSWRSLWLGNRTVNANYALFLRQATISLQKNFPRERTYYFWAIFCTHMLANDAKSSEMDRKLFGTLAYRMIAKAAADVPTDPVGILFRYLCFCVMIDMIGSYKPSRAEQRLIDILTGPTIESASSHSKVGGSDVACQDFRVSTAVRRSCEDFGKRECGHQLAHLTE